MNNKYLNLNNLALNRLEDNFEIPKEIYMVEGKGFITKPSGSPYEISLYDVISFAINNGLITIDSLPSNPGNAIAHTRFQQGKASIVGEDGEVTYTTNSNGLGTLTISSIDKISSANIIVELDGQTSDVDGSNNFTLTINDSSSAINSYNPNTDSVTEHDLFVPIYRVFDIGMTTLNLSEMADDSLSAEPIVPTITFGNGSINLNFSGNTNFGSKTRLLITLNFN